MKHITTTILLFLLTLGITGQQITPSEKVQLAFSEQELAQLSENEINELNIKADHLCWFEVIKQENTDPEYTLTDKNGNIVTLSDADLVNFNPLLYVLPQDDFICGNLVIVTSEGHRHLLVVRSISMMNTYISRVKIQQQKSRK